MLKPEYRDIAEKGELIVHNKKLGAIEDFSVMLNRGKYFRVNECTCTKCELQIEGKTYAVYISDDDLDKLFGSLYRL